MKWGAAAFGVAVLTFLVATPASADRVVLIHDWEDASAPMFGRIAPDDERGAALLLVGEEMRSDRVILRIAAPQLNRAVFSVRGHVRYSSVEDEAFIEVRAVYADGFTLDARTDHPQGLGAPLTGDSEWRPFELTLSGHEGERPERIEIRLIMEGRGGVVFSAIRIVELSARGLPARRLAARRPWWNEHRTKEIFIIAGLSISALLFFVVLLAIIARGRGAALGILNLLVFGGAAGLIGAVVSLYFAQPWAVWFPMVMCGLASFLIPLIFYAPVAKRFDRAMSKRAGF